MRLDRFEKDPESGIDYPKRLEILVDDERIQGTVKYAGRNVMFQTPVLRNALGNATRYYRLLSDCSARLNIEGKAVEIDYPEVYEVKL